MSLAFAQEPTQLFSSWWCWPRSRSSIARFSRNAFGPPASFINILRVIRSACVLPHEGVMVDLRPCGAVPCGADASDTSDCCGFGGGGTDMPVPALDVAVAP